MNLESQIETRVSTNVHTILILYIMNLNFLVYKISNTVRSLLTRWSYLGGVEWSELGRETTGRDGIPLNN